MLFDKMIVFFILDILMHKIIYPIYWGERKKREELNKKYNLIERYNLYILGLTHLQLNSLEAFLLNPDRHPSITKSMSLMKKYNLRRRDPLRTQEKSTL